MIGAVAVVVRLVAQWFDRAPAAPPCPKCGDASLVAFDRVLQRFVCDVCSHQWRAAADRDRVIS